MIDYRNTMLTVAFVHTSTAQGIINVLKVVENVSTNDQRCLSAKSSC